ncbi:MAG: prohibitin family protein [Anaerolineales bacterium]|jgi:regulator of protease activity HflC (stomatin/prohibitin superfamily)|uniref:prohibitin family protein n=1 Tax=Candidatus Villigracilis affinis TaxID=3140682 RepID=UPI001B591F70|nr:prohibitin family protein [Anaerolineales bacterium]MBK9604539.1 prohibitin family protein [Anaerolineales bacterium]MBL0343749.1 prohibitin family protein [Anaerolineales bacterium]MBP8047654.1 prohibitin family protein [Anaerolineales bacterium]
MNISSLLQGLASFAWLGFVGVLIMIFVRASRNQPAKGLSSLVVVLLVAAILLTSIGAGLVFLQANEYGVVISAFQPNGYRTQALGPGLHWIIPFIESVQKYSIAKQTYTMSSTSSEGAVQGDDSIQARTKDGQQIFVDASVIYAADPTQLIQLHITWQNRYEENVVRPVARAAIRNAVSQFGVEELVSTKRGELEQTIRDEIESKLKANNIIMSDFLLRNIRFSDEYAAAVEQKQIAEQQAQQSKNVIEQKKNEAEQARQIAQGQADAAVIAAQGAAEARLIQAQAEAQANQLLSASLTPTLLQYQYILKLAPGVQTIFIPSGNQFILPLPDTTLQTQ